jgi:hypothetical protein
LKPNVPPTKLDEQFFLGKIAEVCRQFGKVPTAMEFRIHRRTHPDFPNHKAIYRHFQSTANMPRRLAEWASADEANADIAAMLAGRVADPETETKRPAEGFVYLIRVGCQLQDWTWRPA